MATKLNRKALEHARELVKKGKVERDVRDDWSEHAPRPMRKTPISTSTGLPSFRSGTSGSTASSRTAPKGA